MRALRHGMAGQPGYELFGPWEDAAVFMPRWSRPARRIGLRLVGGRCLFVQHAGIGLDPLAAAGGLLPARR